MTVVVGIDVAKEFHWVSASDAQTSELLLDRRVDNGPASIDELIERLRRLQVEHGSVTVGIDVVGGIASLLAVMLAEAGFSVVDVPGLAVNRARQGTRGGEHKSDPRDARVIGELVRTRDDLRPLELGGELDAFYARKRAEGKRHHQALIALARRRVDVLHAILRTRQPYRLDHAKAA